MIWTLEEVKRVAKNCRNKNELKNRYNGAYKAAKTYGCLNDLFKKNTIHASTFDISIPKMDIYVMREELTKIAELIQKELRKAYVRNFKEKSIIIVEKTSTNMKKMKASMVGEIYLLKDNQEIYDWFDTNFHEISKKIAENNFLDLEKCN